MTDAYRLAEQNIREYTSRLKHIDELLAHARDKADDSTTSPDMETELVDLLRKRDTLAGHLDKMRLKSLEDWQSEEIEKAGPLAVWDAVAQQIEKLVERFEKKE